MPPPLREYQQLAGSVASWLMAVAGWLSEAWLAMAADGATALPELCVFDLDMCMWTPEMYTMSGPPSEAVLGLLGSSGEGTVGASNGSDVVRLFPGALQALQECAAGKYPGMRLAVASSADTPLAVSCAKWVFFAAFFQSAGG